MISVYSAVGVQIPLAMSGTSPSQFLKSLSRERTQSSSAVLSKSCGAAVLTNDVKSTPSNSALLTASPATLSPHYHTPPGRSRSLPRGARSGSAEPDASLPVGFPSGVRTPSPRLMRRAETIDTYEIKKEEFEVHSHCWVVDLQERFCLMSASCGQYCSLVPSLSTPKSEAWKGWVRGYRYCTCM